MVTRSTPSYEHVARMAFDAPWAVLPSVHRRLLDIVSERLSGGKLDAAEIQARIEGVQAAPPGTSQQANGGAIAVLPLYGLISQRAGLMTEYSGGTSAEAFASTLRALAADPGIVAIVIDVDSPGGGVYGVPEAAQAIYEARAAKPIVAVSNSLNASAAYWLTSQAHEIVASPSSETGSIGVYMAHTDKSGAAAASGVKYTLVSAGKYKTEGNPFEPLADEALGEMQARVDRVYGDFIAGVARGRGVSEESVRSGYGQGRVVGAKQAVSLNLADRVDTLEGTIRRLSAPLARMAVMRGDASSSASPLLAAEAGTPVPVSASRDIDALADALLARLAPQLAALRATDPTTDPAADEAEELDIDVEQLVGAIADRMKGGQ